MQAQAIKGDFYLPGGAIQPEVAYVGGRKVVTKSEIKKAKENAQIHFQLKSPPSKNGLGIQR